MDTSILAKIDQTNARLKILIHGTCDFKQIERAACSLWSMRDGIIECVNALDEPKRSIIRRHYLFGFTWERIAHDLNLSDDELSRLRAEAIKDLEQCP